jgi:hypothetical protein
LKTISILQLFYPQENAAFLHMVIIAKDKRMSRIMNVSILYETNIQLVHILKEFENPDGILLKKKAFEILANHYHVIVVMHYPIHGTSVWSFFVELTEEFRKHSYRIVFVAEGENYQLFQNLYGDGFVFYYKTKEEAIASYNQNAFQKSTG